MTLFNQYTFDEIKGYYNKAYKEDTADNRKEYYVYKLHSMVKYAKTYIPNYSDVMKVVDYFLLNEEIDNKKYENIR